MAQADPESLTRNQLRESTQASHRTPVGAERLEQMSCEDLELIVQASMDGWTAFIETGLGSDFYREASDRVGRERAARVTLMYLYLNTFAANERDRLENDVEYFLHYAAGFLRELFLPGSLSLATSSRGQFKHTSREIFIRAMRGIFRKNMEAAVSGRACQASDAHVFMRSMLKLSASVEGIVDAWDDYKEYMYRLYPQLHHVS